MTTPGALQLRAATESDLLAHHVGVLGAARSTARAGCPVASAGTHPGAGSASGAVVADLTRWNSRVAA